MTTGESIMDTTSIKGVYRHTKSAKAYEVIGIALHTENEEKMVVYRPLYDSEHELFVRPYDMFFEIIELDGENVLRFEKDYNATSRQGGN